MDMLFKPGYLLEQAWGNPAGARSQHRWYHRVTSSRCKL